MNRFLSACRNIYLGNKKKVISHPDSVAALLCLIFLLLSYRYSIHLNLWGDEAFSLELAGKSWSHIFHGFDIHFPPYYFFLKILINLFGQSNEILLRIIHSVFFGVGLFVGYRIIYILSKSYGKALAALFFSIFIPAFSFYGTNIRMYSLLFLFSMWHVYRVAIIIVKDDWPTKKEWGLYLTASSLLILIDYPGITTFLLGGILLFFSLKRFKKRYLSLLIFCPIFTLVIYAGFIVPVVSYILIWPKIAESTISLGMFSPFELLKSSYLALRPIFDLSAPFQKNMIFALFVPSIFALGLFFSLFLSIKQMRGREDIKIGFFLILFAFYWLIGVFSSHSAIVRVFLPALFFMPAFLILSTSWLPPKVSKINVFVLILVTTVNISQAFSPTFRLNSLIPYKAIALDSIAIARKENIKNILISNNSLQLSNSISIKRYINNIDEKFNVYMVSEKTELEMLSREDFLFVAYMGEYVRFLSHEKFITLYDKNVTHLRDYLLLDDLPYNYLWKMSIKERSPQNYAVSIYTIRN